MRIFFIKNNIKVKIQTTVKEAEWDEKNNQWVVKTTKNEIYRARFFINCCGFLHKPNIPKFKNAEKYKGRMFHCAQWEWDFDFTDKKVAVVGSGCSAVQDLILQQIVNIVQKS